MILYFGASHPFSNDEMYCVFLLILLHCCKLKAQVNVFTINNVMLRAHPSNKVQNGERVVFQCSVDISKSEHFALNYTYSFSKLGTVLFTSTSEQDWAQYTIRHAKFSDSGEYECSLVIEEKTKLSNPLNLTVKGITRPILTVQKTEVTEGEKVPLRCEVPGEKPPIYFTFFKIIQSSMQAPKQIVRSELQVNYAEVEFPIYAGDSILFFECRVEMRLLSTSDTSESSNRTMVTVVEPFSIPNITVKPSQNITEGDEFHIDCTSVARHLARTEIIIQKNKTILKSTKGKDAVQYSKVAKMEDNGNYTCKVERGSVSKISSVNVVVAELFSKPKLVLNKTKWDEGSILQAECLVNSWLPKTVSLLRDNRVLVKNSTYRTRVRVVDSGSYVCKAEIKGIVKESDSVKVQIYAPVSQPEITVPPSQVAVIRKNFTLNCYSRHGTPPITYTLYKGGRYVSRIEVKSNRSATFSVKATEAHVTGEYRCRAENGHSKIQISPGLNISVIAPVGKINLRKLINEDVEDGKDIALVCDVSSGSFPIKFSFFRENDRKVLYENEEKQKHTAIWHKEGLTTEDEGNYYCTADNKANAYVKSNKVFVRGKFCLSIYEPKL
uniref:Platelet endothelial cell adhesion molecule n=1 Tax=Salvator merianae TaxID=96440 RepID=A0A8D0BH44_SALMN